MNKLLRILALAIGFIALFQSTEKSRLRGQEQEAAFHDCIETGDSSGYPACTAEQYYGGSVYYCSTYSSGNNLVQAADACDPNDEYADCGDGDQSRFTGSTDCGSYTTQGTGLPQTINCSPDTDYYVWGDDKDYCSPLMTCATLGMSCNGNNPCCSAYQCISGTCQTGCGNLGGSCPCCDGYQCISGTCLACSLNYQQACTPSGASQACGTVACNGSCLAECGSAGDCWSDEDDGTCVNGCCQWDGGGGGDCPSQCAGNDQAVRRPGPAPMYDITQCGCDSDCQDGYCDPTYCTCQSGDDAIIVDLGGAGFTLTSVNGGVRFDLRANGQPQQIAWTSAGWHGGFLVLDRDGSGHIASGAGLFTGPPAQPASGGRPQPAGFRALAAFDQPAKGGNGDGQIDARDAIYAHLRVWVDSNHNGVSDPGELLSLPQLGISSISLKYQRRRWTDVSATASATGPVSYGTAHPSGFTPST